jgi:hypothetical protein
MFPWRTNQFDHEILCILGRLDGVCRAAKKEDHGIFSATGEVVEGVGKVPNLCE